MKRIAETRITDQDRERSCTVHSLDEIQGILSVFKGSLNQRRILDVGCGFGGLALTIGEYVGASEVHGIDIDRQAAAVAAERGMTATYQDISNGNIGYPSDHFSLVTSFGPHYDDAIIEMRRVLAPSGFLVVSLPNLASWHNRLLLLSGYQPRDVEVSRRYLVGVHPRYRRSSGPTGHIHTVTTRGFEELMRRHRFRTVLVRGAAPRNISRNTWLGPIDAIFARFPNLARRFFYVGQKADRAQSAQDE